MATYQLLTDDHQIADWMTHQDYVAITLEVSSILRGGTARISHPTHPTPRKGVIKSTQHVKTK